MTKNQLDYWRNEEDKRHNRENERETKRSNLERERETYRSNRAKEDETNRSNLAQEAERARANTITMSHYQVMDDETRRHNLENERLAAMSTQVEKSRVNLGYYQTQVNKELGFANLDELSRSNMARENETQRHNVFSEVISSRAENTKERQAFAQSTSANAAVKQANVSSARAALEAAKFTLVEVPSARANISLSSARAADLTSQISRREVQNTNDIINTGVNVVNSIFTNVERIVRFSGGMINAKGQ